MLHEEALSGRGDRGVVGLSCGLGFGTMGAGCIIGDAGSDGGFLFTCQSSESSSAKKLSDINKKELKLKESAKLGKRVLRTLTSSCLETTIIP